MTTSQPSAPTTKRQARVYAFPAARNVRTVKTLLARYLDLCRTHGHLEAVRVFEVRYANPIRRRLTSAGVPAASVQREIDALKVAMHILFIRQNAAHQRGQRG